ncbi:MAG: LytTR family DNA-binding domain-containing protein [Bacteroidia bacterium]|nr:LytTR family DNA-binding domain-containing protein [Bacteroidia bacterium]
MTIRALIIEDESLAAKRLEAMIRKCEPEIEIITHLSSISAAVNWLATNKQPDLFFMDIHLEDGLSFSIFEKADISAPVIFTTAFDEYTIKAFKVNSIDYLLKPINADDLAKSIEKYKKLNAHFSTGGIDFKALLANFIPKEESYKNRFLVSSGSNFHTLEVSEIAYFHAEDKLAYLVTKTGRQFPIDFSLDKLIGLLNPQQFFRINRQFIISSASIQKMTKYAANKIKLQLNPSPEKDVFVSLEKYTDFKKWLDN